MRTMTSGMFQRIAQQLAPEWQAAHDLYEVAFKFVLSDSRVHLPIVGMRWPDEVAHNVAIVENFQPSYDMAALPRLTAGIYQSEDEMGQGGEFLQHQCYRATLWVRNQSTISSTVNLP